MSCRSCRTVRGIGRLRHLADIRQPATPTDGETKPTWTSVATNVPMSRMFKAPREVTAGDRVQGVPTEKVMMSWRPDVDERMRLIFPTTGNSEVLEIVGIGDPMGDRKWLEATCVRVEYTT